MLRLTPDLKLQSNLERLAMLVKTWPGEVVDEAATIYAHAPEAEGVPIYWCFNNAAAFVALGQYLGESRTLVGMRSLNKVLTLTPDTAFVTEDLARYYATCLLRRFGTRPCIIGGNCQAAAIAWRVALHLRAAGAEVQRLILTDAEPRLPYPGRLRLLFGARSTAYNPRLKSPDLPEAERIWPWDRAWHRYELRTLPGGHGEYLRPDNLPAFAQAITDPVDPPPPPLTAEHAASLRACQSLRLQVDPMQTGRRDCEVELRAGADFGAIRGLAVVPLWRSADGALHRAEDASWVVPVSALPVWRHRFTPPPGPGPLTLHPVLCMAGHGPLDWQSTAAQLCFGTA